MIKNIFYVTLFIITSLCSSSIPLFAQQAVSADTVYIARYKGDRKAAVCYSFDDGIKDQYTITYPMLKSFGFTATFFVIPSQIPRSDSERMVNKKFKNRMTEAELKTMAANGMEIANHTWTHSKPLTRLNDEQLKQEIEKADSAIFRIIGSWPLTFAYPWNAFNARTQAEVLKKHIASREFQFGIGSRFTAEEGNKWIDGLIAKGDWGITMAHAMSNGFDSLKSPDVLRQHFAYVKQHENEIWVTTFRDLTKYIKERDSTSLIIKKENHRLIIKTSSTLPATVYDEPLTFVFQSPHKIKEISIRQGTRELAYSVDNDKILFDALPADVPIIIKWK